MRQLFLCGGRSTGGGLNQAGRALRLAEIQLRTDLCSGKERGAGNRSRDGIYTLRRVQYSFDNVLVSGFVLSSNVLRTRLRHVPFSTRTGHYLRKMCSYKSKNWVVVCN